MVAMDSIEIELFNDTNDVFGTILESIAHNFQYFSDVRCIRARTVKLETVESQVLEVEEIREIRKLHGIWKVVNLTINGQKV